MMSYQKCINDKNITFFPEKTIYTFAKKDGNYSSKFEYVFILVEAFKIYYYSLDDPVMILLMMLRKTSASKLAPSYQLYI